MFSALCSTHQFQETIDLLLENFLFFIYFLLIQLLVVVERLFYQSSAGEVVMEYPLLSADLGMISLWKIDSFTPTPSTLLMLSKERTRADTSWHLCCYRNC